jgi:hypothetical protein
MQTDSHGAEYLIPNDEVSTALFDDVAVSFFSFEEAIFLRRKIANEIT